MEKKSELKAMVRGKYDIQKIRIQTGLRIVANFKAKIGQDPGEKEKELKPKELKILNDLRVGYKNITDGITRNPTVLTFKGNELISSYSEFVLVNHYINLESAEKRLDKDIAGFLPTFPLWEEYLDHVKGVGPVISGVIISEFDIHKARYPSSLHAYAGLDVASDGRGRSRRKEHLVDIEYTDKNGKEKTKKSITYNPFLKSKLMGVLAPSFMMSKSPYKEIYDHYKFRLKHHAIYKDVSDGHRDMMAKRYKHIVTGEVGLAFTYNGKE